MSALSTIAKGDSSHIVDRRRVVARTPEEWAALWAAHAGPESDAPPINFGATVVAGAFAGLQPPGPGRRSIEIAGAVDEEGGIRLVVEERPAGVDADATISLPHNDVDATVPSRLHGAPLSPFHIILLPRVDGEIRWTDTRHRPSGETSTAASRIARGAHSRRSATGLRPRTAGVLSYLAGPVSGVIMLVAEPEQPFVRFHAWQSVIALGALTAAVGICYLLALVSLFFTANGLALMVRVATGVWVALLVVWAVLMWQAWRGVAWKLPLAGDWAERLAAGVSRQRPAPGS